MDASVIITTYNQSQVLETTLLFLARQNFVGSWELIICDDGSSQSIVDMIQDLAFPRDVFVRYIWQQRNGEQRARSRNNGLLCAKGRVIILVDGDLVVPHDFITKHVMYHSRKEHTLIYGTRRWIFLDDLPEGLPAQSIADSLLADASNSFGLFSEEWFQEKYSQTAHSWRGCMGCNLSFASSRPPVLFDEGFIGWGNEDIEFAYRLQKHFNYRLRFAPEIFGLHLENRSRSGLSILRPTKPDQICAYVRNCLYLHELHPEVDPVTACELLGHYTYDTELRLWVVAPQPRFETDHIWHLLGVAKQWLSDLTNNHKGISDF